jgi:phage FluMu protein Com
LSFPAARICLLAPMPIRFPCQRCRQLLGIASRKAGSEIQCPKCGWPQLVPGEEAAAAIMAMDRFARNHEAVENTSVVTVFDDQPAAIETQQSAHPQQAAPQTAVGESQPRPPAQPDGRGGRPLPSGMILYPRRILYVQGILLLIVFVVGFGSGYLIGRGGAEDTGPAGAANRQRVLVEGNLAYDPSTGQLAGDQDAVIIALPQGEPPKRKIPPQGIGPQATPAETQDGVLAIRELGGDYARADASGSFSLVVPDRGLYHLLIISNHATRPDDAGIDEADLIEMERYFSRPAMLIGPHEYRWTSREITQELRIDQSFSRPHE